MGLPILPALGRRDGLKLTMASTEFRDKAMRIRSARDIVERFRVNWDGYIRERHVMCRGRDALDTFHPAIRLVSTVFGPILGPIVGKLFQLTVVVALTIMACL